jgi:hypothetical protein
MPEIAEDAWGALSPSEQAALEDGWALSWALDYHICALRQNALVTHLEKLYDVQP